MTFRDRPQTCLDAPVADRDVLPTNTRKTRLATILVALVAANIQPVAAHHSTMFFDINAEVVHENVTVVEFVVANPHGVLIYIVTDDDGDEVQWQAELPSGNFTRRGGISASMLTPGDRLPIVVCWPGIPGLVRENTSRLKSMEFPNGDVATFTPVSAALTKGSD